MKIIKKLLRIYFLLRQTSYKGWSRGDNEVIIWTPLLTWRFILTDRAAYLLGVISALSKRNKKFSVKFSKDLSGIKGRTIYLSYSRFYMKKYGFANYPGNLHFIAKQLEYQNNKVIPSSSEIEYWENKTFMHAQFDALNIPSPKTAFFKDKESLIQSSWEYPYLIKEEHSASSKGVHKIKNEEDLHKLVDEEYLVNNEQIIVQHLLNMRRDLRVTLVGDKILHYYWRINNDKDWRPTSTGRGSSVDFKNFPEHWRSFIIEEFKKLELNTGAFDVAWENDDLESVPLILEVSPAYQLNPVTEEQEDIQEYGQYKKSLHFSKRSYDYKFVEQTFEIVDSVVENSLLID